MKKIRIALVDDHKLFRKGIAALIGDDEHLEVAFEAGSGLELFEKLVDDQPELVLMDLEMPGMDGIEATQRLAREFPEIKVIVLTMHEEDHYISNLMEVGAAAYLLKSMDVDEVDIAIKSVMETGFYFSDRVSKALVGALTKKNRVRATFNQKELLSQREVEVLKLLCQELSSEEIGDRIHLSPRTVEGYRRNLLSKTGARNLAGLVVFAIKNNYYDVEGEGSRLGN